jgi:ATP-binding protein involved in chromosome partitioning
MAGPPGAGSMVGVADEAPRLESLADARARIGARLAEVSRCVAVASGKGGVGKSLVTVHLALALARRGLRVAVLDADLNSPSVAKMLGLRGQPLRATAEGLAPVPGPLGLAVQSMDFFLQGTQALDWEGPAGEGAAWRSALESAALADLLAETAWGPRDVLLIDLPPGPDRLPALAQLIGPEPQRGEARRDERSRAALGTLAVTIPTEVALLSLERAVRRAREARIPLIGLVENLSHAVCGRCGAEGPLFREAPTEARARDLGLPIVARVPFDPELGAAADAGRPLGAEAPDGGDGAGAGPVFDELAERVQSWTPPPAEGEMR